MTGPGTNVALYMEYALRNLLGGMDATTFSIVVVLIGIIFTNFCNSVVLGLVLTPVLLAVANAFDISSAPMMACFIYAVLIAACTPAASPFAALLYGQTILKEYQMQILGELDSTGSKGINQTRNSIENTRLDDERKNSLDRKSVV